MVTQSSGEGANTQTKLDLTPNLRIFFFSDKNKHVKTKDPMFRHVLSEQQQKKFVSKIFAMCDQLAQLARTWC